RKRLRQVNVVQRLYAEPIARYKQRIVARVPDRKRKHAIEAMKALVAPFEIGIDDDLGVGVRSEFVTAIFQLGADASEVVDLSVVGRQDSLLVVGHGLGPGG